MWVELRRHLETVWPQLQGTAAATVAWLIAQRLPHEHDPFFAPIAAFIALNAPTGERGLNAVRLVSGVIVGILAGELAIATLPGTRALQLAVATLVATVVARASGGTRITIAQAASGAILTVAVAGDQAGVGRLLDALIGAGVAVVFSQLLFSPEPVKLVRGAERAALDDMAGGLELAAQALERDDDELGDRAIGRLRDMRDRLAELGRVRLAGGRVARRSAVWRGQRRPVVRETENAAHLDLLANSCLALARIGNALDAVTGRRLASGVRDLAGAIGDLAKDLGSRDVRQAAAERALAVARRLAEESTPDPALDQAIAMTRTAVADVMAVAGVDPKEAIAVVRDLTGRPKVPDPPHAPRMRGASLWTRLKDGLATMRDSTRAVLGRVRR